MQNRRQNTARCPTVFEAPRAKWRSCHYPQEYRLDLYGARRPRLCRFSRESVQIEDDFLDLLVSRAAPRTKHHPRMRPMQGRVDSQTEPDSSWWPTVIRQTRHHTCLLDKAN